MTGRPLPRRRWSVDGQEDVPGLLLRLDVSRGIDYVLQRIGPVDDGAVLPFLDELLEEQDVLLGVPGRYRKHHLLDVPEDRAAHSSGMTVLTFTRRRGGCWS